MFPQYQLVTDGLAWIGKEGWQYRVLVNGIAVWASWTYEKDVNPDFKRRFELLNEGRAEFAKRCQEVFSPDGWF